MSFGSISYYNDNSKSLKNNITAGNAPPPRSQKTFTAVGNAQISTAQSKFGGASGYFDGNGDYIQTLNFNDTSALNSDFTIEFWAYFTLLPSSQTSGGGNYMVPYFSQSSSGIAIEPYILLRNTSLDYGIPNPTSGVAYGTYNWTTSVVINQWYHFAVVRNGGVTRAYRDGVQNTSTTGTAPATTSIWLAQRMNFGAYPQTNRGFWQGYMDEFRVSFGARYTAAFTPSTNDFVHDSETMLLLHMDGTNGSTTFTDSIT